MSERVLFTAAWHLAEVLPNPPNPASPWRDFLANKIILDIWGGSFTNIATNLVNLADYGITDCVALIHNWQRSGYDNALPMHYPANPNYGGDAGMSNLVSTGTRGELVVGAGGELRPPDGDTSWLEVLGATEHNLQGVDVRIPLGRLVVVTGVSGSGKSTLVADVLHRGLLARRGLPVEEPGRCREIRGDGAVGDVVLVDQSPIGKTARSNPASYVGALDGVRALLAAEPLARERGYAAGTFSFNAGTGRCPACGGTGFERVEMQFLADVWLRCPDCDGRRFRPRCSR